MQHLLERAATPEFVRLEELALEFQNVHEISLGTDPVWRSLNRAHRSMEKAEYARLERLYRSLLSNDLSLDSLLEFEQLFRAVRSARELRWLSYGMDRVLASWMSLGAGLEHQTSDPEWPRELLVDIDPTEWPWAPSEALGGSVFVFTAVVAPGTAIDRLANALREQAGEIGESLRTRVIARPPGALFSGSLVEGGASVYRDRRAIGTVGGVLVNNDGEPLVATASHVVRAGQGVLHVDTKGPNQGRLSAAVKSSSDLKVVSGKFDWSIAQTWPRADFALLGLDEEVDPVCEVQGVGPVETILDAAQVGEGATVSASGAASGLQDLRVGDLVIAKRFLHAGEWYGLRDLFQLRRQSAHWSLAGTLRRPARPKDSGAWVTQTGSLGTGWAGVVVGGDDALGYACFSQFALEGGDTLRIPQVQSLTVNSDD